MASKHTPASLYNTADVTARAGSQTAQNTPQEHYNGALFATRATTNEYEAGSMEEQVHRKVEACMLESSPQPAWDQVFTYISKVYPPGLLFYLRYPAEMEKKKKKRRTNET